MCWKTVDSETGIPHNFIIAADMDGNDVWIGTSKGLAWGQGAGYYPRLRERTPASGKPAAGQPSRDQREEGDVAMKRIVYSDWSSAGRGGAVALRG